MEERRRSRALLAAWPLLAIPLWAQANVNPANANQSGPNQSTVVLDEALQRLDRLEAQNRALLEEIRALRGQLAALKGAPAAETTPPLAETVELEKQKVADLEQTKVGTDHRLPVTLTGTVLFNTYLNSRGSGGAQNPTTASTTRLASGGATLRQTTLGLKFQGADLPKGGRMNGFLYMDFFAGNAGLQQTFRLRVASLSADWKRTSLGFAFDKPIIAARDPDSLAQVGVSPLTGAGNLWLWLPQARLEQRFGLGSQAGLRAQVAMYQTNEAGTGLADEYGDTLAAGRPGYEGRLEYWREQGGRRIEFASGFHRSTTRVIGRSAPSKIFTLDWLIRPTSRLDFTGTFFSGENVGVIGGLRQGVTLIYDRFPISVESKGGWGQLKYRITPRLSVNAFSGQQDDRNSQLTREHEVILKNQTYGMNLMYRWGSNIMTGIEASQVRTLYRNAGLRLNNHYDLAIAYMF